MAERGPGKARGRSRARSQGQPDAPRRPGQPTTQKASTSAAPRPAPTPAVPVPPAVGRVARGAIHTSVEAAGSSRVADVESLASGLASLTFQRGGNGDNGARGGGRSAWRGFQQDPVTRPAHVTDKRGDSGKPCQVVVNYFKLDSTPSWVIYQYHVDFSPEVDNIRVKRGLVYEHKEMLGIYQFDGHILYKIRRLEHDEVDVFSINKFSQEKIRIHVKLTKEVAASDPVVMNIMGIQLRRYMRIMDFKVLNRLYYDQAGEKVTDTGSFRVWPGFSTAVHQYDLGTMLCADLCFKILRNDTVLDQLQLIFNRYRDSYRDVAARELVGAIILTKYNNLTYRIDDISWDKSPLSTFPKNGVDIKYMDYYKQHWNLEVRDKNQPMLVSMPKKSDIKRGKTDPMLLVPEFSIMTGISDEMRSNFNTMKDIATHTRVGPQERADQLEGFMTRMKGNAEIKKDMHDWGLGFATNLLSFQARIQKVETIIQAPSVKPYTYVDRDANWEKQMRGNPLLSTIDIKDYLLIATSRDMQLCSSFIETLYEVCKPMGIRLDYPVEVSLSQDRAADYTQALRNGVKDTTQLVICVVPNNRKDRYDAIKKSCCVDNPVASQVILTRTISKPGMLKSVATKIGIQLNCKLGGAAWTVEIPIKNLMVIGYDSYHDSSQRGRSVGAVCCSVDDRLTQYYSRVTFQVSRQEMIDGLKTNVTAAIRHFYNIRKTMPDRIIVYRDGVGEGDLSNVKDFELEQIQTCFREMGANFSPRLTFIVVSKRINTRIFQRQGQNIVNPVPGTTVDTTITRPEFYDFFLVSQSVRQGTVTPTQYNVIHDESGLKPDHLQRLTYKLTHLYYNWPGTIRVPAPCLYAHKLAFLTGQSLHSTPSESLAGTLFFL